MAHRSRNTWNGEGRGGGGGGGWMHPQVLLKNGSLTNCLLFGNTKVCCYSYWLQLCAFAVWKSCGYNPKVVNITTTTTT